MHIPFVIAALLAPALAQNPLQKAQKVLSSVLGGVSPEIHVTNVTIGTWQRILPYNVSESPTLKNGEDHWLFYVTGNKSCGGECVQADEAFEVSYYD